MFDAPTFTREMHGSDRVLVVAGEIDLSLQSAFRLALQDVQSERSLIIDFCRCPYFDSSVIAELVRFHHLRAGAPVRIAAPSPLIQRVLEISSLDRIFPMVDCVHAS